MAVSQIGGDILGYGFCAERARVGYWGAGKRARAEWQVWGRRTLAGMARGWAFHGGKGHAGLCLEREVKSVLGDLFE